MIAEDRARVVDLVGERDPKRNLAARYVVQIGLLSVLPRRLLASREVGRRVGARLHERANTATEAGLELQG